MKSTEKKVRYNGRNKIFFGSLDTSRFKVGQIFSVEAEGNMGSIHVFKLKGVKRFAWAGSFDPV